MEYANSANSAGHYRLDLYVCCTCSMGAIQSTYSSPRSSARRLGNVSSHEIPTTNELFFFHIMEQHLSVEGYPRLATDLTILGTSLNYGFFPPTKNHAKKIFTMKHWPRMDKRPGTFGQLTISRNICHPLLHARDMVVRLLVHTITGRYRSTTTPSGTISSFMRGCDARNPMNDANRVHPANVRLWWLD